MLQEYIAAPVDVHPSAPKRHSFGLQSEPLIEALFGRKQDFSARAHYPVPREPFRRLQRPNHLARGAWKTRGLGHLAVGRHFGFGYAADGRVDLIEHDA